MDITVSLFTAHNIPTSQTSDLSVKNPDGTSGLILEDPNGGDKSKLTAQSSGLNMPQEGNDLPHPQLNELAFENVLKESFMHFQDSEISKTNDMTEKMDVSLNEEEQSEALLHEFIYLNTENLPQEPKVNSANGSASTNKTINIYNKEATSISQQVELANRELATKTAREQVSQVPMEMLEPVNTMIDELDDGKGDFSVLVDERQEDLVETDEMRQTLNNKELNKILLQNDNTLTNQSISNNFNKILDKETITEKSFNDPKEMNQVKNDAPLMSTSGLTINQNNIKKDNVIQQKLNSQENISSNNFEEDLSQKVQIMINAKENSARVSIDPPELGQIEIKIVQDAQKTHIIFHTSVEQTHDLIESSLFKLRTQMELQGLNLGDVTVSHGGSQDSNPHSAKRHTDNSEKYTEKESEPMQYRIPGTPSNSQLDLYA